LKVCIIGLGYVGLPLAVTLSGHEDVTGFDLDDGRIAELRCGDDRTGEVDAPALSAAALTFTTDEKDISGQDIYIVTVPTPVSAENMPDLSALRAACRTVGGVMGKGAIVVFESTVYPGVTEDVCGAELEAASGLVCGTDFFLGYSPERVNPGDKEHTIDRITKVVAGQTVEVAAKLETLYSKVTKGGVFLARDIRTAEAAKVIENAQRDINIAFINEVTQIFHRLDLSVHDVLDAAKTKWNFLDFRPGLVGGHCIGVDPFYLAHCAETVGHHPEIILSGRRINDGMGDFIARSVHDDLAKNGGEKADILVLGLTFKENVPDLRNSKVVDVIRCLESLGHRVHVDDPMADKAEAKAIYDLDISGSDNLDALKEGGPYGCVLGAVAHDLYRQMKEGDFMRLLGGGGLVADIKDMWSQVSLGADIRRWRL
jgi:UDP-N-acetyl-D-glucosamine/UDP-N-acetyl-D-galactosamine dehydrogenase